MKLSQVDFTGNLNWSDCYRTEPRLTGLSGLLPSVSTNSMSLLSGDSIEFLECWFYKIERFSKNGTRYCDLSK